VIANENEAVFRHFREANPHMCVRKPNGDWVIEFPVEAPPGAIVKADLTAIEFLELVKRTQLNWVVSGTVRSEVGHHNVSNTVQVRAGEWDDVADYLWQNRTCFSGVTLISETGDKDYAFAPCEAISTEADEARWNQLLAHYQPVDYSTLIEDEGSNRVAQEPACAGGACEVGQ
jgi:ribonucleoside-diphosphate reductase alpha chain